MNILDKIYKQIFSYYPDLDLSLSLWGNDVLDSFQFNFDFPNYNHIFNVDPTQAKFNLFFICGPLNKLQERLFYESFNKKNKREKILVVLRGSIYPEIYSNDFEARVKLEDKADLRIDKYPYDLDEIVEEVTLLVRKKLDD